MLCLLQLRGADGTSMTAISGASYFGGAVMALAGVFELILGNTFIGAVLIAYAVHFAQTAYSADPLHALDKAYVNLDGTLGSLALAYNAGNGMYCLTMSLISLVFFLGSLRTSLPLALLVFCLIPMYAFLAASR